MAGTDVSGKSRQEIVATIEERAKNTKVGISGDVTASASLTDLGTTVDAQATADAVMARGDTLGEKLRALVSQGKSEVPVVSTVGAGDSSVAGYILADVNGGDETERLRTAMAYGSAAASLPGTTLPTPADLPEQEAVVTRLS